MARVQQVTHHGDGAKHCPTHPAGEPHHIAGAIADRADAVEGALDARTVVLAETTGLQQVGQIQEASALGLGLQQEGLETVPGLTAEGHNGQLEGAGGGARDPTARSRRTAARAVPAPTSPLIGRASNYQRGRSPAARSRPKHCQMVWARAAATSRSPSRGWPSQAEAHRQAAQGKARAADVRASRSAKARLRPIRVWSSMASGRRVANRGVTSAGASRVWRSSINPRGQAAAAAVAALLLHPCCRWLLPPRVHRDGQGGKDPGTGRQIEAEESSEAVNAGQVFDSLKILIAGAADPLHPAVPGQGLRRREVGPGGSERRAVAVGSGAQPFTIVRGRSVQLVSDTAAARQSPRVAEPDKREHLPAPGSRDGQQLQDQNNPYRRSEGRKPQGWI